MINSFPNGLLSLIFLLSFVDQSFGETTDPNKIKCGVQIKTYLYSQFATEAKQGVKDQAARDTVRDPAGQLDRSCSETCSGCKPNEDCVYNSEKKFSPSDDLATVKENQKIYSAGGEMTVQAGKNAEVLRDIKYDPEIFTATPEILSGISVRIIPIDHFCICKRSN